MAMYHAAVAECHNGPTTRGDEASSLFLMLCVDENRSSSALVTPWR